MPSCQRQCKARARTAAGRAPSPVESTWVRCNWDSKFVRSSHEFAEGGGDASISCFSVTLMNANTCTCSYEISTETRSSLRASERSVRARRGSSSWLKHRRLLPLPRPRSARSNNSHHTPWIAVHTRVLKVCPRSRAGAIQDHAHVGSEAAIPRAQGARGGAVQRRAQVRCRGV